MIIPSFYPNEGGAERQLKILSAMLKNLDQNFQIEIITRSVPGFAMEDRMDGCKITRLKSVFYPYDFLIRLALKLFSCRRTIDIIHVHTLNSPALLCAMIGKILGLPVITKVTRSGSGSKLSALSNKSFPNCSSFVLFRYMSKFVAITDDIANELVSAGCKPQKIVKIPNGVNLTSIRKSAVAGKKITCACVGRLIVRKNIKELVRIWAHPEISKNFDLVIVGDGPQFHAIKAEIQALNLSANCKLLGELDQKGVSNVLKASQIFIHPSVSEGLSNAVLEAMAHKNFVIARDLPTNREVLRNGEAGKLFTDINELYLIMQQYIDQADQIISQGNLAYRIIKKHYALEMIGKKYIDLYYQLKNREG